MKRSFVISIILIMCAASLLSSCSGVIKRNDAIATVEDFFDAVSINDFEKAEKLLHRDCTLDVEKLLSNAEADKKIDFQSGVGIEKYTGFASAYYDSRYGGSMYELTMKASVSDVKLTVTVTVIQNDNGYGIYDIEIE